MYGKQKEFFVNYQITTELPASKSVVARMLLETKTLEFVAEGAVTYDVELPNRWQVGEVINLRPRLFGVMPPTDHLVQFTEIDLEQGLLRTKEIGKPFRRWNHTMLVEHNTEGSCWYTDHINFDAGFLDPLAKWFVAWFYTHRHMRWIKLLAQQ